MFWDKVSHLYDFVDKIYNGRVNKKFIVKVVDLIESNDNVLECACGTGMISKMIAAKCKNLIAIDLSDNMLKRARSKCRNFKNAEFRHGDITHLDFADESFDKVVAGNVFHLLDKPELAFNELKRVCKKGGKIIIPTYVNHENTGKEDFFIRTMTKLGVEFKVHYTFDSYKKFFKDLGYNDGEFFLYKGTMPCAIAVFINH